MFNSSGYEMQIQERDEKIERLQRDAEQLIVERDNAEEAVSQAYYLVIGKSPEWSNAFGHKEALEEIEDACSALRQLAKKANGQTKSKPELCPHGFDPFTCTGCV